MSTRLPPAPDVALAPGSCRPRLGLGWAFTLFSPLWVVAYLPTLCAIVASGDASQHSVLIWLTWLGANLTMGAWLYEEAGRRVTKPVLINACNATMCVAICAVIAMDRWG